MLSRTIFWKGEVSNLQARNSMIVYGGCRNIHIWTGELAEGVKAEAGVLNKDRTIDLQKYSLLAV